MRNSIKTLGLLLIGLSVTGCDHEADDPLVYQNQAVESYVLGNYQESLLSLKTGLKLDPSNQEMRKLLGEVWFKLGDPVTCVEQLNKAKELGMNRNILVLPLAQCYQYQGKYKEVIGLNFEGDLHVISDQDIAELLAKKSMASLSLNDSDISLDYLDKAMNLSPEMPEVLLAKAHWLSSNHETEQALLVLETLRQEHPKFAQSWGLLGDLHRFNYELNEAEDAYSQAIILADNQLDLMNYYVFRSLVRTYKQTYDLAIEDLQKVESIQKDNIQALYVRGMIDLAQKNYPEAIQSFQSVISRSESFVYANYFLGLSYTLTKNLHSARDHLAKFTAAIPKHAYGQKLLALVELQLGENASAVDRLEDIIQSNPKDSDAFHLLGEAYFKNGQITRGTHYLQKALEIEPTRTQTQLKLGMAHLELDDSTSARWAFDQVLEKFPQYKKALLLKFVNEFKSAHHEIAMNLAKAYSKYYPNEPLGLNLQALVFLAQQNTERANALYKRVLGMDKHDPTANTQLAKMALAKGQIKEAEAHLETIIAKWPHVPSVLRLARLQFEQGQAAKGIAILQKATQDYPNALAAHLALTRFYLKNKEHDKAINQLFKVPTQLHQKQGYQAMHGLLHMAQGDYHQAAKIYSLLEKEQNHEQISLEFLSEYAHHIKDFTAGEAWANQLMELKPRGRWVRWKANAQWSLQKHHEAIETLRDWVQENPKDAKSQMWYANYLMRDNQYSLAKNVYKNLLKTQPNNPIIYNNLAWILRDTSPSEAKFYIEKALKIQPNWQDALKTKQSIENSIQGADAS